MKIYFLILSTCIVSLLESGFCQEPFYPPQPVLQQTNFLMHEGIEEMNVEKALDITERWACFFADPFDAVFLHVEVDGQLKDIIIISDAAMDRLTIWQCKIVTPGTRRVIEGMKVYKCEDNTRFSAPSGMDVSARNRLFDPANDVIYVADLGNHRIVELAYHPDASGGKLIFNRSIGESYLSYPLDVAISAYGDGSVSGVDLYVVDAGTFNYDGSLHRFSLNGTHERSWDKIVFAAIPSVVFELKKPASVACFPDSVVGTSLIYVTEDKNRPLICASSTTDSDLKFVYSKSMRMGESFDKTGGIALDDYGRVYAANEATGKIEMFEPYLARPYEFFGELGEGPGQLNYPSNIIIDTYHGVCEALVIEFYYRFSGLQSYIIEGGCATKKPILGFETQGLVKSLNSNSAPLPEKYKLHDAYPNPFNASCIIAYDLPEASNVRIDVFNIMGQLVTTLVNERREAGSYQVTFYTGGLASGMYFYKINADSYTEIKKAILLK